MASQKWTLFCVHYYSKLLMCIYINYIPLETWVHCLQTATVNWCWDNISMEIFKKKTDFFQYLAHPPLWKKQESGKIWHQGFSFSCGVLENSGCLNLLYMFLQVFLVCFDRSWFSRFTCVKSNRLSPHRLIIASMTLWIPMTFSGSKIIARSGKGLFSLQ